MKPVLFTATLLVSLLSLSAQTALAHTGILPHIHPHAAGVGDWELLALSGVITMVLFFAIEKYKS